MSKKSVKASILGKRRREQAAEQSGDVNRRGTGKAQPRTTNDRQAAACGLKLRSQLHRQCVAIVAKLLAAQATKRAGCTVKGLCLAPHVQSKKAVYAVVCETMRYQPVLQQIVDASSFREAHPEVRCAAGLPTWSCRGVTASLHVHTQQERVTPAPPPVPPERRAR